MSRWYLYLVLIGLLAGCTTAEGSVMGETAEASGQAGSPTYVGRPETVRSQAILTRVKGSEDNQAATRR